MSSPYAKFSSRQSEKCTLRNVSSLTKGKKYVVYKFDEIASQYNKKGKDVKNLRAFFEECGLKFFCYVPADFDDPEPESIAVMNSDIAKGEPPFICYYGRLGSGNLVKIHPFGESVNEELLTTLGGMEQSTSPLKRTPSESSDEVPAKVTPKAERETSS